MSKRYNRWTDDSGLIHGPKRYTNILNGIETWTIFVTGCGIDMYTDPEGFIWDKEGGTKVVVPTCLECIANG